MWTDLAAWFQSAAGARILQGAVIPALAIIVAGIVAGLLGRAAVRSALTRADREQAAAVVAGLVEAARALVEPDPADGKDRRRAARMRSELDVRLRLLPVPGAALAADWAALRLATLQRGAAEPGSSGELADFRDRLVAWALRPRRARALFTKDIDRWRAADEGRRAAGAGREVDALTSSSDTDTGADERTDADPTPRARKRGRARTAESSAGSAEPRNTPSGAVDAAERGVTAATPSSAAATVGAEPSEASTAVSATPAWRRARAAADARGGQEGAVEPEPSEALAEAEPVQTAPVAVQHAHRAVGAPAADADEAVRLEAQQLARHARAGEAASAAAATTSTPTQAPAPQRGTTAAGDAPSASTRIDVAKASAAAKSEEPAQAPTSSKPTVAAPAAASATPTGTQSPTVARPPASNNGPVRPVPGAPTPSWLDTYDDEAEVTQTMNLKTPPPVAAMSVRDRNRSGDDIVPRQ